MQDEVSPSEGEDNTLSYQYGWLKWNENSKTSSSKRGEDPPTASPAKFTFLLSGLASELYSSS